MSKIMNQILIEQELGRELSEIKQKERDEWRYQDEDTNAEKKAELILGGDYEYYRPIKRAV